MSNFRQREILELARKDGKVTVDGLAEAYNVRPSAVTCPSLLKAASWNGCMAAR